MFQNYLKTAYRNFLKYWTFSLINVGGLAIGIAGFLLILGFLLYEYSYDASQPNRNRIYRLPMTITENGEKQAAPQLLAFTYPAVAPALKQDYPEIQEAVRLRKQWGVMRHDKNQFVEDEMFYYVDPALFKVFSFDFLKGDPANPLSSPDALVITESTAKKYFGNADPLGQILVFKNENYRVTGIIRDIPENAHWHFDVLGNFEKYEEDEKKAGRALENNWTYSDYYTYILLDPAANPEQLRLKLPAFAEYHLGALMKKEGFRVSFELEALQDIHLHSRYAYELAGNGDFGYLKYLAIAAIFILVIALINYVNLATARAIDRAREVGVRKVIGAARIQVIGQFIIETVLVNLLAILAGLGIYLISLPFFARFVEIERSVLSISAGNLLKMLATVFLAGGILAGIYPSFLLSAHKPLHSLKPVAAGPVNSSPNKLRRALVVLQFSIAIVLISGAMGFHKQLRFMNNADLGINIKQTLVIHQPLELDSTASFAVKSFIHEIEKNPAIRSVTLSVSIPGSKSGGTSDYKTPDSRGFKTCRDYGIDSKFVQDYGLSLIAGRNFDPSENESNVMLNETAARILGFRKETDAIGHEIQSSRDHLRVVGLVKDFHQESLQSGIEPIVFYPDKDFNMSFYSVKVRTGAMESLVAYIREKWSAAFPGSPFTFSFLDDVFNQKYKNDRLFSTTLWLFTIMAIFVSCLGLFGLSLYTVRKRVREMSIRKILGASPYGITWLLTGSYMVLVLIASITAVPASYLLLHHWLLGYAFHIQIGPWLLITPIMIIASIAWLTIIYHSLRAATVNPAKFIRNE